MSSIEDQVHITLPTEAIEAFCRRWHITEVALFGSVLRDDFGPKSDIDVLVAFRPEYQRSLDDRWQCKRKSKRSSGARWT
jgi:predicted nucleotidyltransferase